MANKKQWRADRLRKIWIATTASTADRDTKCDDIQYNNYAWKLSNGVMAAQAKFIRKDIVG